MITSDFLESYPLFKKLKGQVPSTVNLLPKPPIDMYCQNCNKERTFNMENEFYENFQYSNVTSAGQNLRLLYQCGACNNYERVFYIYIDTQMQYLYKIGQYPEWEIKIDKEIELTLGKHVVNFRRGLVCESQSYGIGAFAYYRRIVEEVIDELLESIFDLIPSGDKQHYQVALEKTKHTRVAQEKITIIKDLLPDILKPNGMNPLGVLHSELSEGVHNLTDEDCLERAGHIKNILIFLIIQILHSKKAAKSFTDSMRSLLDKKSVK